MNNKRHMPWDFRLSAPLTGLLPPAYALLDGNSGLASLDGPLPPSVQLQAQRMPDGHKKPRTCPVKQNGSDSSLSKQVLKLQF
jgi:hypothetical protein